MFKRKKEEEDDDKNVLMLMPVEMIAEPSEGSIEYIADCGHNCWIAPNSMIAVMDPDVTLETTCLRCVNVNAMAESVKEHGMLALPGAIDSVRKQSPDDPFSRFILGMLREQYPTDKPDKLDKEES